MRKHGQRGIAVIVVLVLLSILAVLLAANARTLARVKAQILLVESKQREKYAEPVRAASPPSGQREGPAEPGGRDGQPDPTR